ncbi:hypothetical protein LEMLEM_LOCUS5578 [Lemmus lemmus]
MGLAAWVCLPSIYPSLPGLNITQEAFCAGDSGQKEPCEVQNN